MSYECWRILRLVFRVPVGLLNVLNCTRSTFFVVPLALGCSCSAVLLCPKPPNELSFARQQRARIFEFQ
jgi:hypothetical protein